MGFWNKLKKGLSIGRMFSPKLNEQLEQAEQLQEKVEQTKQIADQVTELVDEVKDLPNVLEQLWSPGSRPAYGGEFVLFRGKEPVRDYQGDLAQHTCRAGRPLPPGFRKGDRWRQVNEL